MMRHHVLKEEGGTSFSRLGAQLADGGVTDQLVSGNEDERGANYK
jgi:hypothetical protein